MDMSDPHPRDDGDGGYGPMEIPPMTEEHVREWLPELMDALDIEDYDKMDVSIRTGTTSIFGARIKEFTDVNVGAVLRAAFADQLEEEWLRDWESRQD